jgi:hypothetical protein
MSINTYYHCAKHILEKAYIGKKALIPQNMVSQMWRSISNFGKRGEDRYGAWLENGAECLVSSERMTDVLKVMCLSCQVQFRSVLLVPLTATWLNCIESCLYDHDVFAVALKITKPSPCISSDWEPE